MINILKTSGFSLKTPHTLVTQSLFRQIHSIFVRSLLCLLWLSSFWLDTMSMSKKGMSVDCNPFTDGFMHFLETETIFNAIVLKNPHNIELCNQSDCIFVSLFYPLIHAGNGIHFQKVDRYSITTKYFTMKILMRKRLEFAQ